MNDVDIYYAPASWRVEVFVGPHLISSQMAYDGHHLAAAARELLTLYSGAGDPSWGMLNPDNGEPIRVEMRRV